MALAYILGILVAMVTKSVLEKKKAKQTQIPNPKGGATIELSDDTELASLILSCIIMIWMNLLMPESNKSNYLVPLARLISI